MDTKKNRHHVWVRGDTRSNHRGDRDRGDNICKSPIMHESVSQSFSPKTMWRPFLSLVVNFSMFGLWGRRHCGKAPKIKSTQFFHEMILHVSCRTLKERFFLVKRLGGDRPLSNNLGARCWKVRSRGRNLDFRFRAGTILNQERGRSPSSK